MDNVRPTWRPILRLAFGPFMLCLLLTSCRPGADEPISGEANAPPIALTEVFRVGDEASGDSIIFGNIAGLAVNSLGHLFIGDRSSRNISVFSSEFDYLGQFGAPGKAPGEFEFLGSIVIGRGDSIYVSGSEKLVIFDPINWFYVREIGLASDDSIGSPGSAVGISDAGPVVVYGRNVTPHTVGQEFFVVAALTNWSGEIVSTLARLPMQEMLFTYENSRMGIRHVPFRRSPTFRISPGGVLYAGWNESIEIAMTSVSGESLGVLKRDHTPVPVTQEDLDEISNPDDFETIHKVKPAYQTFVVDDRDQVWIKSIEQDGPTVEWLVLDGNGSAVGRANLPADITTLVVQNGRVYGATPTSSMFDRDAPIPMVKVFEIQE